jgi:hypothetical protein
MKRGSFRQFFQGMVFFLGGIILFACPWFFRNYLQTHNPFYPLGQMFFNNLSDAVAGPESSFLAEYENLKGFWKWNQWLFYSTIGRASDYYMHLGWPLLHYIVIFFGWKQLRHRPWISVAALSVFFFYFSPTPRIFLPVLGLTWIFLPYYLRPFSPYAGFRVLCTVIMLVFAVSSSCMMYHAWFMSYNRSSQDYLIGMINDDALLMKDEIMTPVVKWVRDESPKDSRIWLWCEDKAFYFDRWVRPSSPYDYPSFLGIRDADGIDALSSEIERDHIDYVVVNTNHCPFPLKVINLEKTAWRVPDEVTLELSEWISRHLKLIGKDNRFELYEIL